MLAKKIKNDLCSTKKKPGHKRRTEGGCKLAVPRCFVTTVGAHSPEVHSAALAARGRTARLELGSARMKT